MSPAAPWTERIRARLDDPEHPDWVRPGPTARQRRADALIAAVMAGLSALNIAASQSLGQFGEHTVRPRDYAVVLLMAALLVLRRTHPVATMLAATALFIGGAYLGPAGSMSLAFQIAYFTTIYSAVAWARQRAAVWTAMLSIVLVMVLWILMDLSMQQSVAILMDRVPHDGSGPFDPVVSYVVLFAAMNLAFFGGAAAFGRASWRAALRTTLLAEQAETIRAQAQRLSDQAVLQERMRLARELHDAIGHHFTGVGMLAGGARRRLEKAGAPGEAHLTGSSASALREALLRMEGSSREGIAELRTILAVLRDPHEGPESAEEEPGLTRTLRLPEEMERAGLAVRWEMAVSEAMWQTLLRTMGLPAQLAFLRMVQESLTNAAKHAGSGTAAFVVRLRAEAGLLEGEVTDDGGGPAPVGGVIGGSGGRGLRGLRERAEAHGGHASWGPRIGGPGWFVRFALPLPPEVVRGQLEPAQGVSRG